MEGKRLATTRTETYMALITIAALFIPGFVDEEMPLLVALLIIASVFVTSLFSVSRRRYSWIVAFLYYVFMIPILLYFIDQITPFAMILSLAIFIALAFMAFSENERIVHKIFL